jgi:hypothetical protein
MDGTVVPILVAMVESVKKEMLDLFASVEVLLGSCVQWM